MGDPYKILGVSPNAEDIVIEAAYRTLVKEHHPDAGGDPEKFDQLKKAYDSIMSDGEPSSDSYASDDYFQSFADALQGIGTPVTSETVRGTLSSDLIIEKGPIKIELISLFRTDISELVFDHLVEERETENRYIAVFRVENISDNVEEWNSDKISYVDEMGQQYSDVSGGFLAADHLSPLSSQFTSTVAELQPRAHTLCISTPENIPPEVSINRVVYNHNEFPGNQTSGGIIERHRCVFDIDSETQAQMRQLLSKILPNEKKDGIEGELMK